MNEEGEPSIAFPGVLDYQRSFHIKDLLSFVPTRLPTHIPDGFEYGYNNIPLDNNQDNIFAGVYPTTTNLIETGHDGQIDRELLAYTQHIVAALIARIPIAAIAAADAGLPKMTRDGVRGEQQNSVETTLHVMWARVYGCIACIIGGQLLLMAWVLWYSHIHHTVILRDPNSALSIAQILGSVVTKTGKTFGNLESGEEFAKFLDNWDDERFQYGTRSVCLESAGHRKKMLMVDIAGDVEGRFPEAQLYLALPMMAKAQ